jgi:hypothetical protein
MRFLRFTTLVATIISQGCSDKEVSVVSRNPVGDSSATVVDEKVDADVTLSAHQGIELAFDPIIAAQENPLTDCAVKIVREPFSGKANVDDASRQIKYTSQSSYSGSDSLLSLLTCGSILKKIRISIDVKNVNRKPAVEDMILSLNEDSRTDTRLNGSDIDKDQLSFFVIHGPAKGRVDEDAFKKGKLIYTPPENFNGDVSVTYAASDGLDSSEPKRIKITVIPVYDPPVAYDSTLNTAEETPVNGRLLGTRIDGTNISFVLETNPLKGEISNFNQNTGEYTYTPTANVHGDDRFAYVTFDGVSKSSPKSVNIMISHVNRPVSTEDKSWEVDEDQQLLGIVPASDPDGDQLTFQIVKEPLHGQLGRFSILVTERVFYFPDRDYNGPDYFEVSVSDGSTTAISRHTITVNPVNDPPVGTEMSITIDEDSQLVNRLAGIDVDNDPLTWSVCKPPRRGTLQITNPTTGDFIYKPTQDFNGTDTFQYMVSDGTLSSVCTPVTIVVRPVSDNLRILQISESDSNPEKESWAAKMSPKLASWVKRIDTEFPQPDGSAFLGVQIDKSSPGILFSNYDTSDYDRYHFDGSAVIRVTKSLEQDLSFGTFGYVGIRDTGSPDSFVAPVFMVGNDSIYSVERSVGCGDAKVYRWSFTGVRDIKFGKDGYAVLKEGSYCDGRRPMTLAMQSGKLLISQQHGGERSGYIRLQDKIALEGSVLLSTKLTRFRLDGTTDVSVTLPTGLRKSALHIDESGDVYVSGANLAEWGGKGPKLVCPSARASNFFERGCQKTNEDIRTIRDPFIFKLNSDLSLDVNFGMDGKALLPGIELIGSIQKFPGGNILVGGYGGGRFVAAALLPTGDLFSDFGTGGYFKTLEMVGPQVTFGQEFQPNAMQAVYFKDYLAAKWFATSDKTFTGPGQGTYRIFDDKN